MFLLAAVLILWRRRAVRDRRGCSRSRAWRWPGWSRCSPCTSTTPSSEPSRSGSSCCARCCCPCCVRRALEASGEARETQPLVNVAASLLAAAVLTLLAYAVTQPVVRLSPSPATHAVPVAVTVVLLGFFVLVTRRRALSQMVGFLLIDNGIAAVAFLTTAGVPVVVELGVSLDVLLAVVVLQVLTSRMRAEFGAIDLDELRELHD